MDPLEVIQYLRPIMQAIKYLHDRNYCHNDIKVENVAVVACGEAKLIDFGSCCQVTLQAFYYPTTMYIMAPEAFLNNSPLKKSRDIWSLGILTLSMLQGQRIFSCLHGASTDEYYESIKAFNISLSECSLYFSTVPENLAQLLIGCLNQKEEERPSIDDLISLLY